MQLSPSAHADTFCRDNLPAAGQWPDLEFTPARAELPGPAQRRRRAADPTIEAGGAGRRCLLSPEETWSYGDVPRRASQVARVLTEDLGLVPGNRVLLRGPNNPWLAACWLGVLKAGGVAVATMPMLRAGELAAICEHRAGQPGALRPPVHRRAGRRVGARTADRQLRRRRARRPDALRPRPSRPSSPPCRPPPTTWR